MHLQEFLTKFAELKSDFPRLFSSSRDNENSLYTDALAYSKNAYYVFLGGWAEDCYYGEYIIKCKDCVDFMKINESELCYECTNCHQCYNSNFLLDCDNTRDSEYCYGLQSCANCFLSSNLRHKSFVFKNNQFQDEKSYNNAIINYKKETSLEQQYNDFLDLLNSSIRINLKLTKTENCIGNDITNSKDIYEGYDLVNAENYIYCDEGGYGRDCCDCSIVTGELNYECFGVTKDSYNNNFSSALTTCVDCEFCMTGFNLKNCFGCCYLKGKQYYILNKPYTKEEYEKETEELKKEMKEAKLYNFGVIV